MKKSFLALLTVVAAFTLFACGGSKSDNVELNVAVNFDGTRFISYNKDATYTGLDGKTYSNGDLLPTWAKIGENLGIDFIDKGKEIGAKNTNEQFNNSLTDGFKGIDLINSTGANITTNRGHFLDLTPYINDGSMPNLKKFLNDQPLYESFMKAQDGGIYYTPYLDGNAEVENGFLMRIDWVQKLLDTTAAGDSTVVGNILKKTTPANPATLETTLTVATANKGKTTVDVEYSKNIINILQDLGESATGAQYLNAFRTYMEDSREEGKYEKQSHIFVGLNSGYLVDEMVALMAVVKANPQLLRKANTVEVYLPREAKGSRVRNLFRGLEMYGVRGAVSKNNWLYTDAEGQLADSRLEQQGIDGVNRLNDLYKDGLILQNFDNGGVNKNHRDDLLKQANGFMMYDYNATQTAQGIIDAAVKVDKDYNFQSVLPPVNDWNGDGKYFHFTESVRTLKNEAWGITKATAQDPDKLAKAIQLVDYLYQEEPAEGAEDAGATLFLYGPKEWRHATKTFNYLGEEIPAFSDEAVKEIQELSGGNMINYLREYVGATLPVGHVRSLGLELQTLSEQGKEGYDRVRNAVDAGVYRLAGLYEGTKDAPYTPWYNTMPNIFALLLAEENELKESKKAFDDYWADKTLYELIEKGIRGDRLDAYNDLKNYDGSDWTVDYYKYYQKALDFVSK
ncbi:MAG TPA: hypothetical protein VJ845_00475 [Haploplasma sp.]|nr:hypothetical protein [Haploplasma sp.]